MKRKRKEPEAPRCAKKPYMDWHRENARKQAQNIAKTWQYGQGKYYESWL